MAAWAALGGIAMPLLAAGASPPPAGGGGEDSERREQAGPPIRQATVKGRYGDVEYEDVREIYLRSPLLGKRRSPFPSPFYEASRHRAEVMQGVAVFRYRDRPLWLVHNFYCTTPALAAQMPWTCEATVHVSWDRGKDGGGARVDGNFDLVRPHPTEPLFATLSLGCCGAEHLVAVYDMAGRRLCPERKVDMGAEDPGASVWDHVRVEGNSMACPAAPASRVPGWTDPTP